MQAVGVACRSLFRVTAKKCLPFLFDCEWDRRESAGVGVGGYGVLDGIRNVANVNCRSFRELFRGARLGRFAGRGKYFGAIAY